MKIKEINLNRFKRFTDLTITDLPATARLVVLVGPNGSGKTSLFEAFNHWYKLSGFNNRGQQDYIEKAEGEPSTERNWYQNKVQMEFFTDQKLSQEQVRGKFYFRTAYRNEPDFTVSNLQKQNDPTKGVKLETLMVNDMTVSENYQRLVAQTLTGVYNNDNDSRTVKDLRDELIGKVKDSLGNIFHSLNLTSIGDPISSGSFYFQKGVSSDFHYKNLSAGEKSVFDLILDMIIKSAYYSDAVFCIDEPEAHMHTRLQGKVLRELYQLTPENGQLWISTHSIGMLKEAEEIEQSNPGTVVFLDFDNRDFDSTEMMRPAKIDKAIWDRFFDLAFADFSKLIAPNRVVFCEGDNRGRQYKDFDAQIYGLIFQDKYYDTKFVSAGSSTQLEGINNESINMVSTLLKSSEIVKFVDRDDKSDGEVQERERIGIRTAKRRHIESYLLDDELIGKLCEQAGKSELVGECLCAKQEAIAESVARGNPEDDVKSASGKIFTEIKQILGITQCGNNRCAFLRDTMAPLVTSETKVFSELEEEIFSNGGDPTRNESS